jgi:hypothetical protein
MERVSKFSQQEQTRSTPKPTIWGPIQITRRGARFSHFFSFFVGNLSVHPLGSRYALVSLRKMQGLKIHRPMPVFFAFHGMGPGFGTAKCLD